MENDNNTDATNIPGSTELALDRTYLAHDRTLMAWVRTATSLISFGFTIYKFFQYLREQEGNKLHEGRIGPREFGLLMICIGLVSLLLATIQHWQFRRELKRYHEVGFPLTTVMAAMISLLGILALVAVILRQ
ncbi:MAG: YidH family protein [Blastocatellales bacterium]